MPLFPPPLPLLSRLSWIAPAAPQDIGREFWQLQAAKRERKQRLVQIGRHAVLKSNMYDMNQVRWEVARVAVAVLEKKAWWRRPQGQAMRCRGMSRTLPAAAMCGPDGPPPAVP